MKEIEEREKIIVEEVKDTLEERKKKEKKRQE